MLTTKKRIVMATEITSSTAACLSQSRIRGPSFPEGHVHVELHRPQHVLCARLQGLVQKETCGTPAAWHDAVDGARNVVLGVADASAAKTPNSTKTAAAAIPAIHHPRSGALMWRLACSRLNSRTSRRVFIVITVPPRSVTTR
jgi:hypothetical protein